MDEKTLEWMTSTPLGFSIGVLVLVFGTKAILSEDNVREKLGGLNLVFRWFARRREKAAEEEADERVALQKANRDQHRYILWVTSLVHSWEIWAADHGIVLPAPPFQTITEWLEAQAKDKDK